jgi:hypothetical protein
VGKRVRLHPLGGNVNTSTLRTSDSDLERFFLAFQEGFLRAAESGGVQQRRLTVAGHPVTISFAGNALLKLARPLAHLEDAHSDIPGKLNILAWEGPVGWSPPKPVWKQGQQGYQGEIVGLGSGRFAVNYHDTSGLFHMIDHHTRSVLYWIPCAGDLPFWEIASPFRIIFHWWARSLGGNVAHAAAVGKDGRGVLLVGKGGSGKSTAALACLYHGMEFVGDDYVLLLRDPVPRAHSLYSSAKMHAHFLREAFPDWQEMVAMEIGPENKAVFFLHDKLPESLQRSLEIHAIVAPQVGHAPDAQLSLRPASEGLLALAPSTIFQLPGARREAMTFFSNFIRGIPVYAMRTGEDLASGPRALLELLSAVESPVTGVGDG